MNSIEIADYIAITQSRRNYLKYTQNERDLKMPILRVEWIFFCVTTYSKYVRKVNFSSTFLHRYCMKKLSSKRCEQFFFLLYVVNFPQYIFATNFINMYVDAGFVDLQGP